MKAYEYFADKGHVVALQTHGFCAMQIRPEVRPKIGDIVHLLISESQDGPRVAVRLVAEQEEKDGTKTGIYVPFITIFRSDEQ